MKGGNFPSYCRPTSTTKWIYFLINNILQRSVETRLVLSEAGILPPQGGYVFVGVSVSRKTVDESGSFWTGGMWLATKN